MLAARPRAQSVGDAIVSSVEDGVLSLHVAEGGLVSAKALHVTVRVPDGQLGALTLRAAARDVLLSAAPAPALRVAPGGAGRVVLRPAAAAASAAPGSAGSLILTVTQGTQARSASADARASRFADATTMCTCRPPQPVTVCSPVPQTLSLVAVTNNAVADVRVENYTVRRRRQRALLRANTIQTLMHLPSWRHVRRPRRRCAPRARARCMCFPARPLRRRRCCTPALARCRWLPPA